MGSTCYKLKLTTKKLNSGKFQVKFQAFHSTQKSLYGYLLSDPHTTLKEVVERIHNHLAWRQQEYFHNNFNLYSVGNGKQRNFSPILIFELNNERNHESVERDQYRRV